MKILNILNHDNTLSVNRPLAHALGVNAAIVYAALISKQVYYEQHDQLDSDGFFYSTIDDLEESTALARTKQKGAMNVLLNAGLIELKIKGTPPRRFFRVVDDENLLLNLQESDKSICAKVTNQSAENLQNNMSESDKLISQNAENIHVDLQESDKSICAKVTNQSAENLQNNMSESDKLISQNAENVHFNLQESDKSICAKVTNQSAENVQINLSKTENSIYKSKDNQSKFNQSKEINLQSSIPPAQDFSELTERVSEERENFISKIHENIGFDGFAEKEKVGELVKVMADVAFLKQKSMIINGGEVTIEQIKQRFLELRKEHIEQVLSTLERNASTVRNLRAYLITLLYNAPTDVLNFKKNCASYGNNTAPQSNNRASYDNKPASQSNNRASYNGYCESSFDYDEVMESIKDRYRRLGENNRQHGGNY